MLSSRLDDLYELQWLGAVDAAAAHGVDLVSFVGGELDSPDGYRSQANAIYDLAGADRLDGLIVWTTALERFVGSRVTDEFCRRFDPLPIVSVERVLAGSPSVLMDERQGMDDAVSHLIEVHGCEQIAFIRGPAKHTGAEHRYQGYRDALARHGLRSDPALAPTVSAWAPEAAAVAATKLLADRSAPVDAFATANDDLALGVLGVLDAQHVRVPHDVAMVGFDDHMNLTRHGVGMMLSNLGGERAISLTAALVPLTTVRAPFYQLGWRAVGLLLERLSGAAVPGVVTIPTELVVRRSCGCFPSAVPDVVTRQVDRERFSDTGWEQVANEMRHALTRSNASLPTDWPEQLEAAFVKDVETDSVAAFLELLDELMRASIAAGDTLDNWSRALSALRRHTASAHALADTSPAVEDFWLRVHSLVRELVARLTDYEHLDTARRDRIVRGAGRRLNTAHDAEELTEVLVDELPRLGIPSCHLALYESEGEREDAERQGDQRAWSRPLLVYEAGRMRKLPAERRSFRSAELAPTARLGSATPWGVVAMPLYFQEHQLGFALFEVGPRLGWVYGDLREQLSSALHSALLIEREHRALAALKQAHGELEQRVAVRTAELATANETLARLVDEQAALRREQAALRRVATLVAQAAPPGEVFMAVADELVGLLGADAAMIARVDPDQMMTVVARSGADDEAAAIAGRLTLEQSTIVVRLAQTGRPVRVDDGESGDSVATPVLVAGRLWGAAIVAKQGDQLGVDAEQRMAGFTELVATAIANADGRAELIASRARLLTAADDARRRVVRDLHDGAQQRLVQTILTLKLAQDAQQNGRESADALVAEALNQAQQSNDELRELAHGILPSVLAHGGLQAGVKALVSRARVPVDVAVTGDRFAVEIEASAYFVVAEALTNIAKHSGAGSAYVRAWAEGRALRVEVRDDGVGGARADGTGLLGLHDRLAALGGRLWIESPPEGGTRVAATLPL
jgi:DNA-binding LacI/PurR family transcriptional regulator/signal transduction histidine kinase